MRGVSRQGCGACTRALRGVGLRGAWGDPARWRARLELGGLELLDARPLEHLRVGRVAVVQRVHLEHLLQHAVADAALPPRARLAAQQPPPHQAEHPVAVVLCGQRLERLLERGRRVARVRHDHHAVLVQRAVAEHAVHELAHRRVLRREPLLLDHDEQRGDALARHVAELAERALDLLRRHARVEEARRVDHAHRVALVLEVGVLDLARHAAHARGWAQGRATG